MSSVPTRTQVGIIGGGPAGSLLALLLQRSGVDSVILERRPRAYVLGRVRAGVLEHGSVEVLRSCGLAGRLDREGFVHHGVNLAFAGEMLRVDFEALTGKHVTIYGQTEVQKDLYGAIETAGIPLVDEAGHVNVEDVDGPAPRIRFQRHGTAHALTCDFVAGCDGVHGVTRDLIPEDRRRVFERVYPFVWVGILSETPPVTEELIYANAPDGFALCSMRHETLSRYYVQGSADDAVGDWSDDRFWNTLRARLPDHVARRLVTGPSIEKIVTPLRSWVSEPMSHGRLYLAGDAAHIVPPTGAKGLNLAVSDVVYLSEAFADYYRSGSDDGLDAYSARALSRVWKAVRFSWWMTQVMHRFPGLRDAFETRMQRTELEYLFSSGNAQRAMAENYVGLPL